MKRYRNFVMLEQIKECIRQGRQDEALELAEGLDIHLIKNNSDVNLMADLYIENGMYEKGFDCLREIYNRKKTRSVLMQLINLSVKIKNVNAAEKYFADFKDISGDDFYNHIFRYNIDKIEGKPVGTLIDSLEKLKEKEYIEVWAYELAKLYHKSGMSDKCIKECNDIEVWFGDGPYVERAKALKAYYKGELDLNSPDAGQKREEEEISTAGQKDRTKEVFGAEPGQEKEIFSTESGQEAEETSDAGQEREEEEITGIGQKRYEEEISAGWRKDSKKEIFSSESGQEAEETYDAGQKRDEEISTTGQKDRTKGIFSTKSGQEAEETSDAGASDRKEVSVEIQDTSENDTISDIATAPESAAESETTAVPERIYADDSASGQDGERVTTEEKEAGTANDREAVTQDTAVVSTASKQESEEDDFAEEIKEYEEETTVESVGINIKSDFVEGDEAWINTFLEEEESELAQLIRIECENERQAEQKRAREREEKRNARIKKEELPDKGENAASQTAIKSTVPGKNGDTEKTGEADKTGKSEETAKTWENEKIGAADKTVKNVEPDKAGENGKPGEADKPGKNEGTGKTGEDGKLGNADESEKNEVTDRSGENKKKGPVETVSFNFDNRNVKEIDESSLLGAFLSKRHEEFEDYFEFYAFRSDVRNQLIKTIEILLNPQIKNICMVVTGPSEAEKNVIIRGIARILFNSGFLVHKQILKVEAAKLGPQDLNRKLDSLIGSCFVIRSAGKMSRETVNALLEINEKLTGRTAVVLTDDRSGISALLKENRDLNSMFPQRIHISDLSEKELEEMAYYKLRDSGFLLAKEAQPELQKQIHRYIRSENDPVRKLGELINKAIDSVETRNARVFLARSDEERFEQEDVVMLKDLVSGSDD